MIPTDEQRAILHYARTTNESLIIQALAGSGKTTVLIEVLRAISQPSAIVLAFNKRIADEMAQKLPPPHRHRVIHVKTLHAAGYWILRQHYPNVAVDRDITEERIRAAAGSGTPLRVLGAATKLLRLVKDFQHAPKLDLDYAFHLGTDFGVFEKLNGGQETQRAVEITAGAYTASLDVGDRVDYPDQGWLPLVLNLSPPHRYKAILLDEAQDVNENQFAMVEKLLAPKGRIIACGDLFQQIYTWRGAAGSKIWEQLRTVHKAKQFPLTITWRCDQEIVAEANRLVPDLRARADAEQGSVHTIGEDEFLDGGVMHFEGSVFVLSRTNAELLRVALEMWRRNIPFNIAQSAEILYPLKDLLRKLSASKNVKPGTAPGDLDAFRQALAAWRLTEMMKAQAAGSIAWADRIEEHYKMLLYCSDYVSHATAIGDLLDSVYTYDDTRWITLSTAHKAKGMEADNVFLLRETFQRYQNRKDRNGVAIPVPPEEDRIEYVAITRARHTLTWVHLNSRA